MQEKEVSCANTSSPHGSGNVVRSRTISFTGAGFALIAVTFGLARYSYGLFLPEIGREFGLDQDALGLIASASYVGYLVATVLSLILSGLSGPRFFIIIGAVCATIGMAVVWSSSTVRELAAGVILAGASPGFVFAPISDAVAQAVPAERQSRTWTIMNSGNGGGVLIAGLIAVGAAPDWRVAWLAFTGLAAITAVWNAWVMPSARVSALPRLEASWFLRPIAYPLFLLSFLAGVVTTVYWTFATSLIMPEGNSEVIAAVGAGWTPGQVRIGFWSLLGAAGIAGAAAGDVITRFGLRRALQATCLAMAASVGLTALLPHVPAALAASAVVFGVTFILLTGEIGVWSVHIFQSRPSAGFGMTFLVFALGSIVGPKLAGACAEEVGLALVFCGIMIAAVCMAAIKPRGDIRSMTGGSG